MALPVGTPPGPPFKDLPWKSQLLVSAGLHAALFWIVAGWWPDSQQVAVPAQQIIDVELVSRARPAVEAIPPRRQTQVQAIKELARPQPVQQKKPVPVKSAKPAKPAKPARPLAKKIPVAAAPAPGQPEQEKQAVGAEALAHPGAATGPPVGRAAQLDTANGSTTEAEEAAVRAYQRQITALIERKKRYPLTARKGRQQGRVTLVFQLDPRGNLVTSNVARSSGHRLLDQAALKAVQAVDPFPVLPRGLNEQTRFQVDLQFTLKR